VRGVAWAIAKLPKKTHGPKGWGTTNFTAGGGLSRPFKLENRDVKNLGGTYKINFLESAEIPDGRGKKNL